MTAHLINFNYLEENKVIVSNKLSYFQNTTVFVASQTLQPSRVFTGFKCAQEVSHRLKNISGAFAFAQVAKNGSSKTTSSQWAMGAWTHHPALSKSNVFILSLFLSLRICCKQISLSLSECLLNIRNCLKYPIIMIKLLFFSFGNNNPSIPKRLKYLRIIFFSLFLSHPFSLSLRMNHLKAWDRAMSDLWNGILNNSH